MTQSPGRDQAADQAVPAGEAFVTTPPLGFSPSPLTCGASAARRTARHQDRRPQSAAAAAARRRPRGAGVPARRDRHVLPLVREADAARALSATLKRCLPGVPIVLGGPYPSHDAEQALGDPHVDYIVKGEGEATFDELLQVLFHGGDLSRPASASARVGCRATRRSGRSSRISMRCRCLVYDLLDVSAYFHVPRHSRLIAHPEYMTVVSTRGCPYRCTYCHVTMGKKTRYRSADNVVRSRAVVHLLSSRRSSGRRHLEFDQAAAKVSAAGLMVERAWK
ncbi:MAG: cobalamin-dependent protein [Planctomycetota bacterium]